MSVHAIQIGQTPVVLTALVPRAAAQEQALRRWLTPAQVSHLAAYCRARGVLVSHARALYGSRVAAEIASQQDLSEARAAARPAEALPLKTRLRRHLAVRVRAEAQRRRLSTPAQWDWAGVQVWDRADGLTLVGAEYTLEYSRGYMRQHPASTGGAAYLYGRSDGGWCVRVPRTCRSVAAALEWLEPAAVRQAREAGRWVARQGDVYLVGSTRRGQSDWGVVSVDPEYWRSGVGSHVYYSHLRTLVHPQHAPVRVPAGVRSVRAYQQTQLARTGRQAAD